MIDLQTVSVIVAATSVVLYIANLFISSQREERDRKIILTDNILHNQLSEESWKGLADVMNMEWRDFTDFIKKYDSTMNPGLFAKRMSYISTLDYMGYLYKMKVIDAETVYEVVGSQAIWVYAKFKPIIEEYRRISWGMDRFRNLDYLASEMYKIQVQRDPSFKGDNFYFDSSDLAAAFVK